MTLTLLTVSAAFSDDECAAIIALAERGGYNRARLVSGDRHEAIRRSDIAWLDENGAAAWVFDRIMRVVAEANRGTFGFDLTEFAERMQVARYGADDAGHFDWHADIGEGPLAARRKLTVVVQLSAPEAYDGGALEINVLGNVQTAARQRGAAALFPAFALHRVTPAVSGLRHSLTTWVHGPAFR